MNITNLHVLQMVDFLHLNYSFVHSDSKLLTVAKILYLVTVKFCNFYLLISLNSLNNHHLVDRYQDPFTPIAHLLVDRYQDPFTPIVHLLVDRYQDLFTPIVHLLVDISRPLHSYCPSFS